jgi:hypothetical protein
VLRALGLDDDRDAGRDMGEADRRFGLVDVLAAAPPDRIVSVRTSDSLMSMTMRSSITGKTPTLANEVWRRALESNGEMRTRRCTPVSLLSHPKALRPLISMVADLMPASSPAVSSR